VVHSVEETSQTQLAQLPEEANQLEQGAGIGENLVPQQLLEDLPSANEVHDQDVQQEPRAIIDEGDDVVMEEDGPSEEVIIDGDVAEEADPSLAEHEVGTDSEDDSSFTEPEMDDESVDTPNEPETDPADEEATHETDALAEDVAQPSVPEQDDAWLPFTDFASGQIHYWNQYTNETSW